MTDQDPEQADSIMKIQKGAMFTYLITPNADMPPDLDETKIVLHKTIESVLERGEKIDDLVVRSSVLVN